jgi:hypothetical protein
MAAPIRLVERKVVNPGLVPSPDQRAGLLASLWLGSDGETVVVPVEAFVRLVAREITEAQELATAARPQSEGESNVRFRAVAGTDAPPVARRAAP